MLVFCQHNQRMYYFVSKQLKHNNSWFREKIFYSNFIVVCSVYSLNYAFWSKTFELENQSLKLIEDKN